jgi:hypothetical protein
LAFFLASLVFFLVPERWVFLAAKPSHMGVDVNGLAYPLHHPTTCSHQMSQQGPLLGTALFRRVAMDGGTFLGDVKPPGLDIHWRIDRLGTWVTKFYMEYIVFTRTCLP